MQATYVFLLQEKVDFVVKFKKNVEPSSLFEKSELQLKRSGDSDSAFSFPSNLVRRIPCG